MVQDYRAKAVPDPDDNTVNVKDCWVCIVSMWHCARTKNMVLPPPTDIVLTVTPSPTPKSFHLKKNCLILGLLFTHMPNLALHS